MMTTAAVPANVGRLLDGRPYAWLARRAGWSKSYLSTRMTGRVMWSAEDLIRLADALETTPDGLLFPSLDDPAPRISVVP